MKKLIRIVAVLVVLIALGLVIVYFSLGGIVRKHLESQASGALGTQVVVASTGVDLFSGQVTVGGMDVSNPPGFQAPHAMTLGNLSVKASLPSLFSEVVKVQEVVVNGLHLWVEESGLKTNVGVLLANLRKGAPSTPGKEPGEKGPEKRYQIRLIRITGAQVTLGSSLLGGQPREVKVPEIVMQEVGTGDGGKTLGQVLEGVISSVLRESLGKDVQLPEAARKLLRGETDIQGAVEGTFQEGASRAGEAVDRLKGLIPK